MNKLINNYFFVFLLIVTSLASSMTVMAKPHIEIEKLRVILPPSVARSTAVYGFIKNTGDESDTLMKIRSNAGMVMLHQTEITSGRAQMNHIKTYVINAGKTLTLKPMSYHMMLMGINHEILKKNGQISLTLEFKKQGALVFKIPVLLE